MVALPSLWLYYQRAVVVVEAQPSDLYLAENTTMVFIGIISSIAAIGVLCWLLFTLAVFALPFFAGVSAGTWAYQTSAGSLGAILVGLVAAALTLRLGQFLLAFRGPLWIRLAIALPFVAPAALAGYHATHGIVKHTMPSDTWQIIFSVIGTIAVGATALIRVTAMAAPGPIGQTSRAPDIVAGSGRTVG